MSTGYRFEWPLPDEFLVEIGRVTSLWAGLEGLLNTCLGKLAGFNVMTDPVPFILVTHSSFPQRLDMLGALCEELQASHPYLSDYKEVVRKLKAAQTARNRYSHNTISFDPGKGYFLAQGSARGKVKTAVTLISPQDVHAAAKEIHLATLALYKLVLKRQIKPKWESKPNHGGA